VTDLDAALRRCRRFTEAVDSTSGSSVASLLLHHRGLDGCARGEALLVVSEHTAVASRPRTITHLVVPTVVRVTKHDDESLSLRVPRGVAATHPRNGEGQSTEAGSKRFSWPNDDEGDRRAMSEKRRCARLLESDPASVRCVDVANVAHSSSEKEADDGVPERCRTRGRPSVTPALLTSVLRVRLLLPLV
jgi:hypothetical protein